VSAEGPLKNFTVRLSLDDHARLATLRETWGLNRAATLRRLIRTAAPNSLGGRETLFTPVAKDKTGSGFSIRLNLTRGHHEHG
jgi:hypothetical protein